VEGSLPEFLVLQLRMLKGYDEEEVLRFLHLSISLFPPSHQVSFNKRKVKRKTKSIQSKARIGLISKERCE